MNISTLIEKLNILHDKYGNISIMNDLNTQLGHFHEKQNFFDCDSNRINAISFLMKDGRDYKIKRIVAKKV